MDNFREFMLDLSQPNEEQKSDVERRTNIDIDVNINMHDMDQTIFKVLEIFARSLGYRLNRFGMNLVMRNRDGKIEDMFLTTAKDKILRILDVRKMEARPTWHVDDVISSRRFDSKKFLGSIKRREIDDDMVDKIVRVKEVDKRSDDTNENHKYEVETLGAQFKIYLEKFVNGRHDCPRRMEGKDINEWVGDILDTKSTTIIKSAKRFVGQKYGVVIEDPHAVAIDLVGWLQNC